MSSSFKGGGGGSLFPGHRDSEKKKGMFGIQSRGWLTSGIVPSKGNMGSFWTMESLGCLSKE